MSTFRILHVESSRGAGGQEIRTLLEAQTMSGRGHAVMIAAQPNSFLARQAKENGLSTITIRMNWLLSGLLFFSFIRIIKKYRIQIVVTHGSIDSWLASLAGRMSFMQPRVVRTRHKSTPVSPTRRHALLYRVLPHGVMTTCEKIRKDLIANQGLDPSRVISIPTGVDLEVFSLSQVQGDFRAEIGVDHSTCLIGTVAFLRSYKGIHVCLDAIRDLHREFPHILFIVVGDGPQSHFLKEKVKVLGIENIIRFMGFRKDISTILASLDIFIMGSLDGEGVPQALIQAMAMEVPVVATFAGGIPEVLAHEETGFLVPPNDSEALKKHIDLLVRNPSLRSEMGKKGRELVVEKFSLQGMAERVEQWYSQIIPQVS
ncbi:MAG: glycosyltransferase [Nitrospirae bacterium]|nr:glycosyltransferase [Nitrospirota bacterium]